MSGNPSINWSKCQKHPSGSYVLNGYSGNREASLLTISGALALSFLASTYHYVENVHILEANFRNTHHTSHRPKFLQPEPRLLEKLLEMSGRSLHTVDGRHQP